MQKNLKTKLEQMSKEQLLELLEELCDLPDVQKMIKVMVAPSKCDIDRLIQKLSCRCEIYMCNSCNKKDYDRMRLALIPIYSAYRFADINMAAYITWETYQVLSQNDIEDYFDLIGDMISDLRHNMRNCPEVFTNDVRKQYAEFVEE